MSSGTNNITGIILAGGLAQRMNGQDKSLLKINGIRIIDRLASILNQLTSNVMIISNSMENYGLDVPVYKDIYQGKGPIGGLHSALSHSSSEVNIILACDLPFINAGLLQYLIQYNDQAEIAVPLHDDKVEPLCGIYKKSVLKDIDQHIRNEKLKMHDLLADLGAEYVKIDSSLPFYDTNLFANINTPSDFKIANDYDN